MYKLLLCLCFTPCFAIDVDEAMFKKEIETLVENINHDKRHLDMKDICTFYWLEGQSSGINDAKKAFERCKAKQQ